ncbi:ATP-binding cassette domain-containing protein [Alkalicoccus urumqiensis]|uniref:Energy-coupling factor ABC transporter ATP-binding protein n=1 Tax=Alkalicoccus urumqiensis TaxID=1548213 RepID=A0A2P6ME69_ALKUR|nr:ATP-binding cassette domain-containing protein [Alkalicoccus urumqiensis]PRO64578.1 energy-coupling factor ABC transporter ATP-binding protein [Alkalicoccus urumqiensis]
MQITVTNVSYTYMPGGPFAVEALRDVTVTFASGETHAIIGATGSGKSTLLQLLNGLEKPSEGSIDAGGHTITADSRQKDLFDLRRHIGMVFQFPEQQLFAETVLEDVMFGPLNYGDDRETAEKKAYRALEKTGLPPSLAERSPFTLSGGQMRRAAIAGVLALEPKLLLLDEPTAGLDPDGQEEIMRLFSEWQQEEADRTLLLITHDMNLTARKADHIVLMESGRVRTEGTPSSLWTREDLIEEGVLPLPETSRILAGLCTESKAPPAVDAFTVEDAADRIASWVRKGEPDA